MKEPTPCPTCGFEVRVVGGDEGTMHYEPVNQTCLLEKIQSYTLNDLHFAEEKLREARERNRYLQARVDILEEELIKFRALNVQDR